MGNVQLFKLGDVVKIANNDAVNDIALKETISTGEMSQRIIYIGEFAHIMDITPLGYKLSCTPDLYWSDDMLLDIVSAMNCGNGHLDTENERWERLGRLAQMITKLTYINFISALSQTSNPKELLCILGTLAAIEKLFGKHNIES